MSEPIIYEPIPPNSTPSIITVDNTIIILKPEPDIPTIILESNSSDA